MLRAIQQARRSVRLETYTFDSSLIGVAFLDALVEARDRGVSVRVLIDAIGSIELPDSFWEPLLRAGGEVRRFNPIALGRLSYRDHRKVLAVDEAVAFIGGFNVAREYFGDGILEGWRDLGLEVRGPLVGELTESFDDMFRHADFRHKRLQRIRRSGLVSLTCEQDWQLLLSGPGRGHRFMKRTLARDLTHARTIHVISAYFLPTWRIRRELRRTARRGGLVQLILPGKSDVAISQLASRRLYQGLLKAGVEVYEYQPQVLHAKMVVVDQTVYIGSANLDARGLGINYELLARLSDPELAREAREIFKADLGLCRRISLSEWRKSRGFFQKLLENLSYFVLSRLDPWLARWQWRWWRIAKDRLPLGTRRRLRGNPRPPAPGGAQAPPEPRG